MTRRGSSPSCSLLLLLFLMFLLLLLLFVRLIRLVLLLLLFLLLLLLLLILRNPAHRNAFATHDHVMHQIARMNMSPGTQSQNTSSYKKPRLASSVCVPGDAKVCVVGLQVQSLISAALANLLVSIHGLA